MNLFLETPVGDEGDRLGDFIRNDKAVSPYEAILESQLGEKTAPFLTTLTVSGRKDHEDAVWDRRGRGTHSGKQPAASSKFPGNASGRLRKRPPSA